MTWMVDTQMVEGETPYSNTDEAETGQSYLGNHTTDLVVVVVVMVVVVIGGGGGGLGDYWEHRHTQQKIT